MWTQFALSVFIALLFLITKSDHKKKSVVLPIAFMIVSFFFAIRYEYGNDYWSYFRYWDSGKTDEGRGTGEYLFYGFMQLFDKYYKFVIAQTVLFCIGVFYLVRQYMNPKYYAFFFLFFLTAPTLSYNMMSAMRSTMAACVLWVAIDFFFIRRRNWLAYTALVVVAAFFHTSTLVFLLLPILYIVIDKTSPNLLFTIMIVGVVIVNTLFAKQMYEFFLNLSPVLSDTYSGYLERDNTMAGITIYGAINKSALLFPFYFVCMKKDMFTDRLWRGIWALAMMIIILKCFGLDFNGRISIVLYIFVFISLSKILPTLTTTQKIICLAPLFVYWGYNDLYLFYSSNIRYSLTEESSFLKYKTIFEASQMP